MLATEYKLLKDYGQNYDETLMHLKYALQAVERLDQMAEKYWRGYYVDPGDINGFFIRDDVDEDKTSSNYILNNPFASGLSAIGINNITSDFNYNTEENTPREMSKDQVWSLLVGLALVERLVDEPGYLHQDVTGEYVNFRKWARKITYRIVKHCHGEPTAHDWTIFNPVTNNIVDKDNAAYINEPKPDSWPEHPFMRIYFDYGFAKAGNAITHTYTDPQNGIFESLHFANSESHLYKFHTSANLSTWRPVIYKDNYSFQALISVMGGTEKYDALGSSPAPSTRTRFEWLVHEFKSNHRYEHFRLIFGILHGFPDSGLYSEGKETYQTLLNEAPECGPYNLHNGSNQNWASDNWSSYNRLIWPERLKNGVRDKIGYYNGLDYMFLHNLYWLAYENHRCSYDNGCMYLLHTEYPYFVYASNYIGGGYWEGTDYSPYYLDFQNIEFNARVKENGNVILDAGKSIKLSAGFKVDSGGEFIASVRQDGENVTYQKFNYTPSCSYKKSFSKHQKESVEEESNSTTSIKENSMLAEFSIYPNPAKDILNIQFFFNENTDVHIKLIGLMGQKVFERKISNISNQSHQIDISSFAKGVYFIVIQTNDSQLKRKIIQ